MTNDKKEINETELQKRNNISKKRKRLKDYERLLNKKLGLEGHFIIK